MTTGLFLTLGALLTYFNLIRPIFRYYEEKRKRTFWRYYRHFQLQCVQEAYPETYHLTLNEIRARYNVSEAYNRIR